MPGKRLTGANKEDFRVTIRLDPETYQSLSEAVEQGVIRNISETVREMIRQKLWERRFSGELERDVKWDEIKDRELRRVLKRMLGDFGVSPDKRLVMAEGFLEGLFSAIGGLVRKAVGEFERREGMRIKTSTKLPKGSKKLKDGSGV